MRWGMAPAGGVRLRRAYERNVAARQVNRRGRCQWQPGRVQRPPPLYLFRGYGPRPNDWRRGWWRLACLHTESDVGISFRRMLVQGGREQGASLGAPFSLHIEHFQSSDELDVLQDRSWHGPPGFILAFLCSHSRLRPMSQP